MNRISRDGNNNNTNNYTWNINRPNLKIIREKRRFYEINLNIEL